MNMNEAQSAGQGRARIYTGREHDSPAHRLSRPVWDAFECAEHLKHAQDIADADLWDPSACGKQVRVRGSVESVDVRQASGHELAILTVWADGGVRVRCVVFPRTWERLGDDRPSGGESVEILGKVLEEHGLVPEVREPNRLLVRWLRVKRVPLDADRLSPEPARGEPPSAIPQPR